jgi:hypothetical protein
MEIRLSKPNPYFDQHITRAAEQAGCFARIKWARAAACRFVLVDRADSFKPATFEQHDQVIRLLLELDPHATIRTSRATYEGVADFESQLKVRIPA